MKWHTSSPIPYPLSLIPFLGGIILTLGYAPFHLWPLGVAALALWIVGLKAAPTRRAATTLTLWGAMGHGISALYWLPWAFYHDSDSLLFAVLGGIPASFGLALWIAVGYAFVAAFVWRWRKNPWAFGVAMVGGILVLETLRNLTPYGFPWLPLGALWAPDGHHMPYLAQLASVGSVQLLSGLIMGMALLVATPKRGAWLWAAALLMCVAGFGVWRTAQPLPTANAADTLRLVQPNMLGTHKWNPAARWQFLNDTLLVTTQNLPNPSPKVAILPETAVPFFLSQQPDARQVLATWVPSNTQLVTGAPRATQAVYGQPSYFNSLQVVQGGEPLASIDKHLLVPFGEFIPLRAWLEKLPMPLALRTFSQSRIDFTHGTTPPLLPTAIGPALGLICYEGIFPLYVARHAKGARWLVNVTNDAWFTGTTALYQHAGLQRLRAIETGLPLVRSANTGISIITTPFGTDVARLPAGQTAVYDGLLPASLPPTLWLQTINAVSNLLF